MAEFPAMPLWTDAYLADTTHLTTLEHGAYLLLLMAMWRTSSKSLPNDDARLARFARLTLGQWRRIRPTMMPFFTIEGDQITQGRLTDEANAVRRRSQKQSDRAKSRHLKNNSLGHAVAVPDKCRNDASHIHIHTQESKKDAPSEHQMRASRLSPDWEPDENQRDYAERYGLDVDRVAADFRDYWCAVPGQRGLKLDWNRTWQTRCREIADRMARSHSKGNGHGKPTGRESWYGRRIMERIAAEEQAAHGADPFGLEGG